MHATRTVVLPIWPSKLNLPFDIDKLLRAQPLVCYDGEKLWMKADEIKRAKFLLHDGEIEAVGLVAFKATEGVAAIAVFLGFSSLNDFLTGGDNGSPPAPVDVSGFYTRLDLNQNNLNSLSTTSTLSINNLNTTTASILGYINGYTAFSSLKIINLNVSGFATLNNNVTLLSSLNASGLSTLNNNTTLLSAINISGLQH
jgi:hypothetical protein